MTFAHSGRANKERVALLADKMTGGQFVDARAIDGRIEGEVEVVQRADLAEVGSSLTSAMVRWSRTLISSWKTISRN
jgi:hypothetical protein